MNQRGLALFILAATARADAGAVLEVVPLQAGPYLPGQLVSVEVWLHNEETFDIDLVLVGLDIQGLRSRLFAGGDFLTSGEATVNHVAKLSDGSWTPLYQGTEGPVLALQACALNGGTTLYAGGESPNPNQLYDSDATVHRMESGGNWREIGRGESARTLSFLCAGDGSDQWMYAGGYLWNFGSTESRNIVKWDGSDWSAMPGLNGSVRDMLTFDDGTGSTLYVAGNFPNPMPPYSNVMLQNVAKWTGTGWAPLYTGLMFGNTEWAVNALAVFDDGLGPALFAGGDFWYSYISESDSLLPVFNIARWDGAHWSSLGGLTHGDHRQFVHDMVVFEDSCGSALFVAGRFDHAGEVPDSICSDMTSTACNQQLYPYFDDGVPVNNVARWDGNSWSDVGGGVTGDADAAVYSLAVLDDGSGPALYAAGRFTSAGGLAASNIAKWDGTSWSPVGAGFDDTVRALAVHQATGAPNVVIGDLFQFDFSTLTDGGAQYAVFSDFPLPLIFYLGDEPVPGSVLQLPASGSLRLGAMDITMPNTTGTYSVDVASPYGPSGGSILSFGFGGPTDPNTDWLAENGDLTGDLLPLVVLEGPPPENDDCGIALSGSEFDLTVPSAGQELTISIDNTWATADADDPSFSCRNGCSGRGVGSLWYRINPGGSDSLAVRAIGSGGNPIIALYESPMGHCGELIEVGCSDDDCVWDSYFWATGLDPQGIYYLQVASWSKESQGLVTIRLRREQFSLLQPDPSGIGNRALAFQTIGPNGAIAIKVTMIDLQHPVPANVPASVTTSYTTFDTRINGVCVGGSHVGHHCDVDADCRVCVSGPGATLNRVCANDTECGGGAGSCPVGGTCPNGAACSNADEQNGCVRWVGEPRTYLEFQSDPELGNFRAARLQCTPFYYDWVTETASGPITVVGAEILPSSTYEVAIVPSVGNACPTSVILQTGRFGDVALPFNPPATTQQPDGADIVQLVNKFKNVPTAPGKAITLIQPNAPDHNADVSGSDIVQVVDAFKTRPYPFGGPCPCPSLSICSALGCPSSATVCTNSAIPGLGVGATCVRTCTGGDNHGDSCINNSHCLGGGTCGSPFCRDRCGRCSP